MHLVTILFPYPLNLVFKMFFFILIVFRDPSVFSDLFVRNLKALFGNQFDSSASLNLDFGC